jgi:CHAT domain-containing protein
MMILFRFLLVMSMALTGTQIAAQPVGDSSVKRGKIELAQRDPNIDQAIVLIKEMIESRDPEGWADANKARLTPEVADAADRLAIAVLARNRPNDAFWALTFAGLAHGHLGRLDRALGSALWRAQAFFILAKEPEEYIAVRRRALEIRDRANEIGRMDISFQGAVLAADASYFRSKTVSTNAQRGEILAETLEDISAALLLLKNATDRVWVERFVSLIAAAVEETTSEFFLAQDRIEGDLKKLAPEVERAIPPDFAFGVEQIGDSNKSIGIGRTLARLSYHYGNAAVGSARLAIAAQRAAAADDPALTVAVIQDRYLGERRAGKSPAQLRQLRDDAWKRSQELRASYRSRAGRIWASYLADELFGAMLKGELGDKSSRPDEAFSRIESMKARMLLDRLATPRMRGLDTEQARELERRVLSFKKPRLEDSSLTLPEMRLVSQLSGFDSLGGRDAKRGEALKNLETLYRNANAGYGQPANPISLQAVQKTLAPDEALLEYVIPYNALHPASDLWIFLITRKEVLETHVDLGRALPPAVGFTGRMSVDSEAPVDSSALGNLIVATRTTIRSADEKTARRLLSGLHTLLIEPLVALGFQPESYRRLVIVPHGALHYVPFAALLDDSGRFLIAKSEIVVTPSASVWQMLGSRFSEVEKYVVFANPDLGSHSVADLPYSDQEASEIVKSMPPQARQVFRGKNATKGRLLAEAPTSDVLHLATHGEFPDENAMDEHAIWLADEGGRNEALSATEVRKLPLRGTRLVVLSVCNGGLYRIGPADEPYGLLPAFLEAGAQNVIGTLWPLDDQFGRDFMIEFYTHLAANGAAGALRNASLRFIGEDEYIRRWAAFILVGSGRLNRSAR